MHKLDLKLRAVSDLMITRLRQVLNLSFIGSDNTPPGLINDAYMFGNSKTCSVFFSQSSPGSEQCHHISANLYIWMRMQKSATWQPPDSTTWERVCQTINDTANDFLNIDSPTTHVARLIFKFYFGNSKSVDRDIRRVYFAPILDRYDGKLNYPEPDDYSVAADARYWPPHPSGISLAWEGEYTFARPVPVSELEQTIRASYNSALRLDGSTRLPETEVDGVPCRIDMTARFY